MGAACPKISWRKLSRMALKLRNSRKFSPSKVSHYTVHIHVALVHHTSLHSKLDGQILDRPISEESDCIVVFSHWSVLTLKDGMFCHVTCSKCTTRTFMHITEQLTVLVSVMHIMVGMLEWGRAGRMWCTLVWGMVYTSYHMS